MDVYISKEFSEILKHKIYTVSRKTPAYVHTKMQQSYRERNFTVGEKIFKTPSITHFLVSTTDITWFRLEVPVVYLEVPVV